MTAPDAALPLARISPVVHDSVGLIDLLESAAVEKFTRSYAFAPREHAENLRDARHRAILTLVTALSKLDPDDESISELRRARDQLEAALEPAEL